MQKHLLSLILCVCVHALYAQTDTLNPRKDHPFGININLGGPTAIASLSADYFFNQNVSVEAGAGLFIGLYGGIKFYTGKKKDAFYTGILGGRAFGDGFNSRFFYIPMGYHITNKKGTNFAVELAYHSQLQSVIWGQLRLGFRL
jgi:hypothetical protein